jgi:hypothetical protein
VCLGQYPHQCPSDVPGRTRHNDHADLSPMDRSQP